MMSVPAKKHYLFPAVTLVAALLFCGHSWADSKKRESAKTAATAPAPASIPEITRVAVFQNQGGERLLHDPLALARDEKNGDLLVTSFETGEVVFLDRRGGLIKKMGAESGLASPYGIALDSAGRIYVSEIKTGLLKILDAAGQVSDVIDLGEVTGKSVAPGRITIGKDGLIYLADLNNNEILILNGKGALVGKVGDFAYLQKAGLTGDRIIGLSGQGKAVKLVKKDGSNPVTFGDHGDEGERNVSFPTGFAIDSKGRLWIADAFQHRIKVFTLDGKFLFNYGRMEEQKGGFFFPVDLCFGDNGELFVLEKGASRIQLFHVGDLK